MISIKLMNEWLILSSMKKAQDNRDDFNFNQFQNYLNQKIHKAQRDLMHFYLFGTTKGFLRDISEYRKDLKTLRILLN